MNIAYFIKPKQTLEYLYSDYTVRQAIEKMKIAHYTAFPVLTRDGKYYGTVSEGDFLWYFLSHSEEMGNLKDKTLEKIPLENVMNRQKYYPVAITAEVDEMINVALNQNFIPVVDDLGSFIGIVTRRDIIKCLQSQKDNDEE